MKRAIQQAFIVMGFIPFLFGQEYSLEFNGSTDYVEISHNDELNLGQSQGTIIVRIKLNDLYEDSYNRIVSKKSFWNSTEGYELEVNPGQNIITLVAGNDNFARASFAPTEDWMHVVATFGDSTARIFVNGQDMTTDNHIDALQSNDLPLYIGNVSGSDGDSLSSGFNGRIKEVFIIDDEFSQEEVQQIMFNGIDPSITAAYWGFDEGAGDTLYDASGDSHHGVIHGTRWWNNDSPVFDPIHFELGSVDVRTGDTTIVEMFIDGLQDIPVMSLEFDLSTSVDSIELIGLNLSDGVEDWSYEFNQVDTSIMIAMAGSDPVEVSGLLCELIFVVPFGLSTDYYALQFESIVINNGNIGNVSISGGFDVLDKHPPYPFSLLAPSNETVINITDASIGLNLIAQWEETTDMDNDTINYYLSLRPESNEFEIGLVLEGTTALIPYQTIYDTMFYYGFTDGTIIWDVAAFDPYDMTWSDNGPWSLSIDVSSLHINSNVSTPNKYTLGQNYPNPFNPVTQFNYILPQQSMVAIVVYDINGREIRSLFDGMKESGQYSISWDALDNYGNPVSAGVYLYHIQTDRFSQSRKMILLK
jgi:hypothetical protein